MVAKRPARPSKLAVGRDHPEVYALLWLTKRSEAHVTDFLQGNGIRPAAVQRGMHLTVYCARRALPGLRLGRRSVSILADVAETRFMVMAPGGENRRDDLDPRRQSVCIRRKVAVAGTFHRALASVAAWRASVARALGHAAEKLVFRLTLNQDSAGTN